jgi:CheY-like chemotaxis protein
MRKKRVLIVDDAKDILFLLTHSVKRLGPEYEVSTAVDGAVAIDKLQQEDFDLVITDYMMPGMTGLQLAEEVSRISPKTQVILMTAYDNPELRNQAQHMHLGGIVGKPFTVAQILAIIERIVDRANGTLKVEPVELPKIDQEVFEQIKTLQSKTGAHYVLLLSAQGHLLRVVGQVDTVKAARLASFIAANFMAITELAGLLDDDSSIFRSSYYEGSNYNIYAHDINGKVLLAVVFGTAGKPGTVWFYTKQTVEALISLLGEPAHGIMATNLNNMVAADFDDLLGDEET